MATTYTLISSNTLSSSAASVTFSSIPSTYTDLVLRFSARTNTAAIRQNFYIKFNTDTGTTGSQTTLRGQGGNGASSDRNSNTQYIYDLQDLDAANATANTFSSVEVYIPSYTASQNKPLSNFGASENNTANDPIIAAIAGLWRNTAAVDTITIYPYSNSFVAGSSFYLYGISKGA